MSYEIAGTTFLPTDISIVKFRSEIILSGNINIILRELDRINYIHGTSENILAREFFANPNLTLDDSCTTESVNCTDHFGTSCHNDDFAAYGHYDNDFAAYGRHFYPKFRNDDIIDYLIHKINFSKNYKLVYSLINHFYIRREEFYLRKLFVANPLAKPIFEEYFGKLRSVDPLIVRYFGDKLICLKDSYNRVMHWACGGAIWCSVGPYEEGKVYFPKLE
jgi:hypothetical protein